VKWNKQNLGICSKHLWGPLLCLDWVGKLIAANFLSLIFVGLTVWHLWVYLPSCLEDSQKIWLKLCYYLYTRHNSTKFLGITSETLQFYKFKISSGYKSLRVLYINLFKSTMQSKESKHNILLPKGKICFMEYLVIKLSCERVSVRVRVMLWMTVHFDVQTLLGFMTRF